MMPLVANPVQEGLDEDSGVGEHMASGGGRLEPPRIAHAHTVGPDWPSEASLEEGLPKAGALARAVTFSGALRGHTPSAGELVLQQPLLRPIRTHRASDGHGGTGQGWQGAPSMAPMTAGGGLGGVGSPTKRTSLSRQGSIEMEECRICKEGREGGERMIRPCLCGGSMARVHLRCLQQWLERRRADPAVPDAAALSCEVCKAPYRLHVRERLNLTLDALCSCASLGFYAEFATILVTLAAMVALFYLFAYSQDQAGVGGVAFYISLGMGITVLALGIFTLAKVSQRWRKANLIPVLVPFSSPTSPRSPITSVHNV
ncbi:hypothetical protein KFL_005790030 [Klebsormidium nitens]|uniref:RING-CH-type domain-containing protein n=1 Tax=Klebsormidium nitens TaxID=105231 RepID=A0A1Y1IIM5_KLENI|nr:hypothetical protein KFL_005790030 [Klebsormidium nitens]|eukprot:GAQ89932.1 hypothetical protein KFL_005790030 [Klebsormidium nitens]